MAGFGRVDFSYWGRSRRLNQLRAKAAAVIHVGERVRTVMQRACRKFAVASVAKASGQSSLTRWSAIAVGTGVWSAVGEIGIPKVAVECADIRRNTDGEGRSLRY